MKDRSDDPSHHDRTPLPRSYISLAHHTALHYIKLNYTINTWLDFHATTSTPVVLSGQYHSSPVETNTIIAIRAGRYSTRTFRAGCYKFCTCTFRAGCYSTCTFRAGCYNTRLSWAHTPVINWAVCLGQMVSS